MISFKRTRAQHTFIERHSIKKRPSYYAGPVRNKARILIWHDHAPETDSVWRWMMEEIDSGGHILGLSHLNGFHRKPECEKDAYQYWRRRLVFQRWTGHHPDLPFLLEHKQICHLENGIRAITYSSSGLWRWFIEDAEHRRLLTGNDDGYHHLFTAYEHAQRAWTRHLDKPGQSSEAA